MYSAADVVTGLATAETIATTFLGVSFNSRWWLGEYFKTDAIEQSCIS
jgi:hypothetical protein